MSECFVSSQFFLLGVVSSFAALTSVELVDRGDVLDNKSFGAAGPYERVVARAHFAVDPKLPQNRIIADIDRAPRDENGLVEFSADLYVLKPRDAAKGNGTALFEISNRGGKGLLSMFDFAHGSHDPEADAEFGDKFLLQQGFTLVWVGWEFDVPRDTLGSRGLMHLYAPVATDHGKPIEGLVRSEWEGDERVNTISLGDRAQRGYPVANAGDPENVMYVRSRVDAPREIVPRDKWRFTDETHVALDGGFDPGRIYEVVYKARGAVVAGLGPAAVRDVVSFLKHGEVETLLGDQHEYIKRALGFGVSQSGRFLRLFLRDGFNQDEKGRIAFDGVWAHVAGAGVGNFNARFAQPSRDGNPFFNIFYPTDVPPFNDDGLLAKAREENAAQKSFIRTALTNIGVASLR